MIDCHCHLNFFAFEKDLDDVIQQALKDGVTKIINVGTKLDSSQKAIELAEKYEGLYASVGVHPHHADKHDLSSDWLEQLEKLAKKPKVVAIGEIGLDYFSYKSNAIVEPKLQKELFIKQLELAKRLNLPLQIHNRQAGKDILEILNHYKDLLLPIPGVFHCFAGDTGFLKKVLDLGFYIGFDGNLTYEGLAPGETTALADIAKLTPLDRILTETDSPYLSPIPHRGERNLPSYVIIVAREIAKIKNISLEVLDKQIMKNANILFKINN